MSEPPSPTRPADTGAGVVVAIADEQSDHAIDTDRWAHLAELALVHQGITHGELTVTFVDESTMAELNAAHMGADGPTDVLSFPLDAGLAADDLPTDAAPVLLGDVVICPAVAAGNAPGRPGTEPHPGHPSHDGGLDDELALLVVHGVLHVAGHDHAEPGEAEAMWAAERQVLAAAPRKVPPS
ncbi:MAG: rRNA maturation RNase YbeY [Acidimicrobiales bacterium]|nr:rRNA maturation RNase YbeY [Acidimicrobiales bacterium]